MTVKHKVPQLSEAERKVIKDETMQNTQGLLDDNSGDSLIPKVRNFDNDIFSFESRIKVLKEQLQDELENTDEYTEVQRLSEALKVARENLKRRMQNNRIYMDLTEELGDEKLALKDAKANMSDFLLAYFVKTQEHQIELGPKQAREVIIKGRLGKPKDFQTNIFSNREEEK